MESSDRLSDYLGPDLQNIFWQSYDYLTIMPKLQSTYNGRLIDKTSYKERKAFLGYDFTRKIQGIVGRGR